MKKRRFHFGYATVLISSSLGILAIAIILVASNMYSYCSKYVIDRTVLFQQKALESVQTSVEDFLGNVDAVAASISENLEIIQLLSENNSDPYQTIMNSRRISSVLSSFVYANQCISAINIVTNHFESINDAALNGIISEEYVSSALIDTTYKVGDKGWFLLRDGDIAPHVLSDDGSDDRTICFFKNIYYKNTNQRLGMLLIRCREFMLYDIVKESILDIETQAMIINENNVILSHSDKSMLGSVLEALPSSPVVLDKEQNSLIVSRRLAQHGWTIVQKLKLDYLTRDIDKIMNYTQIVVLIVLFLCALLCTLFSRAITQPLRELTDTVKRIPKSDLQPNERQYTIREVDALNSQFNSMVVDIGNLMEQIRAQEKEKHTAQLKLLQAEINPHFIYNTIELINYTALKNNDQTVCEIVHALGRFLRLSLNNGKDWLTIAQEVEHVTNYAKLQSFKYEGSFEIEWNIAPEVLDGYTLKLLLQPLVENCLVHGFASTGGVGCIRICAMREKDSVIFTVADDGEGINDETAQRILTRATPGYGVYNVNQRIHAAFGPEYGLTFSTQSRGGTCVSVRIPYLNQLPMHSN